MGNDLQDLERMRDLGIDYVVNSAASMGPDQATRRMRSFAYGMASSLALLSGERQTSEFLYIMADHFAVHGLSPDDFEKIGNKIKESAMRGKPKA